MDKDAIKIIEEEVSLFIRRIVITEKRNGMLERSAYVLLRQLSVAGPVGVKSLSEQLKLDISTISRQAAALEQKEYIEKMPNPKDGRSYFYGITNLGIKELDDNKERRYDRLSEVLSDWSEEDKLTFGHLLKKYNQTIIEKDKP
ncbi:MarR family winged helix-turn-helix transcriptional regulator [Bacillus sp. SD088]|uniref:MarR family winged helix-turn-helix transcriptional regulator n=1 Tax=Bacillus sp. SD088 TaxID=2782012 RepID=UPI001A96348B|nr:MarR family transcriptional regulator [Bacillus sp. SD088]MBO0995407.1 MarR family transcriptional regulator [Bacillus sp. SD088]